MSVVVIGLDRVTGYFSGLATSLKTAGRTIVLVGSPLKYTRPIETGMRNGRMWRRAGPARMLGRALDEELPRIRRDVTEAIRDGKPIRPVLLAAGYRVQRGAQGHTPVRTGSLRRSMHTIEARR
jgi:hypothetical protein